MKMNIHYFSFYRLILIAGFLSVFGITDGFSQPSKCEKNNPSSACKTSGNPLIKDMFTADPSALVYNDTLFIYTGSDKSPVGQKFFSMSNWYVFSTTDMVNWTKWGSVFSFEGFSWAKGNAFAGHCIYNNGKFWWYLPATHKSIKIGEGFAIGVAVSDHPTGPFKDAIGKPLITDSTKNSVVLNIDPVVYKDDDGKVYLIWGSWGACRMVKLKDNMIELDGEVQTLELTNFYEAPYVNKKDGTYFLSYASGYPSTTAYSTSTSINGPWTFRGNINDTIPNSPTNHQAIINYKNNWYFIYHTAGLPDGGPYRRSVCIDKLEFDSNNLIMKVNRTTTGVPEIISDKKK